MIGIFNVSPEDSHMETFCEPYGLKNLIKVPTCHKNSQNPSCIDLIFTNSPLSFQSSGVIETGLADFHKMTVAVMKTTFQKLDLKSYIIEIIKNTITIVLGKNSCPHW